MNSDSRSKCRCCAEEPGVKAVCGFLTGQIGPGGHTADSVDRVTAETVVQQLTISNPKAQQDSVDLLLGGRLQGRIEGGGLGSDVEDLCRIEPQFSSFNESG